MYLYTLAFLKRDNEILMLNRNFAPWKGCWNGVGGKRINKETPLECIIREIHEETGIKVTKDDVIDKGLVTWNVTTQADTGSHVFLIELDKNFDYRTPLKTREGILDWKNIEWIVDKGNDGISHNIPYFLPTILSDKSSYNHKCLFENNLLKSVTKERI